MKTTLDLPEDLAAELKRRAAAAGRTPEQLAADLLAAGLSPGQAAGDDSHQGAVVPKHLPLIKARPAVPAGAKHLSGQALTDWLKEIDLQSEVERYEKAFGHQHVDRADG